MGRTRPGDDAAAEHLRTEGETERRWLGYFFALAAVAAVLNSVLPGFGGFDVAGLLVLAAAAAAGAAFLLLGRAELPRAVVNALLGLGTAGIAASISFTEGVPNDGVLLYLWIALYAFYFLPSRTAWCHMAAVAASFALVIALDPPPYPPEGHWATVMGAIAAAGMFVGRLKQRLDMSLDRLVGLAHTDDLTGLPNRRAWSLRAGVEVNRATRFGQSLSVALIDLDRFKHFNDEHGHAAGDRLLADAASAWRGTLRDFDFIARIGGDEFAVLLPGCTLATAADTAQRLRAAMPAGVGCTVGTAQLRPRESIEQTLARADEALYVAKDRRGASVVLSDR